MVNAANRAMRGGGGVDGAIHRAGGPAVLEDCMRRFPDGLDDRPGRLDDRRRHAGALGDPRGRARTIPAGERDRSLLTSCYSNALAVADELGARTVAFPLVSAGIYGWPKQDAVAAAVETLVRRHRHRSRRPGSWRSTRDVRDGDGRADLTRRRSRRARRPRGPGMR